MASEWDTPTFAFHDLDYIPSGYGGVLAPYIETGPGTMRAATTLMRLDLLPAATTPPAPLSVICDLGCGDGTFLIGLLAHINAITRTTRATAVHGVGIDYNAGLLATAAANAVAAGAQVRWLVYDFNADLEDLGGQLALQRVTHVFVYLVPKQLALSTVRAILTRLYESGVMLCFHKFQPTYLTATRRDTLMDLVVYECAGGTSTDTLGQDDLN
ncbi:Monooxygenase [Mycena venus]|uniref:Monooxygenase n=1 Tax=Mycena venus TaxID=2733690 RepID=A0A8H7D681_9AGAR|nr:Monooxygenase [Mycena venus]